MPSPIIRDRPFKKLFKPPMFKHAVMARWYRVGFYKDHRKDVWLEYGQIIIYILRFFKNIY